MASLRLLTALRRAAHFTPNFSQCRVTCELDVHQYRGLSTHKTIFSDDDGAATKPKQKPKTVPVPKITLLLPDNSMTVTDLESALRLAKRRKLNLIKVSDSDNKTDRVTYKLISNLAEDGEINQDENAQHRQMSKTSKILYISTKITKHDLLTKTKNLVKLLKKGNKVKICITLDGIMGDNILSTITEEVKDVGSIQKPPCKKNTILLLISPLDKKDVKNPTEENKEATAASSTINQSNNA